MVDVFGYLDFAEYVDCYWEVYYGQLVVLLGFGDDQWVGIIVWVDVGVQDDGQFGLVIVWYLDDVIGFE